MRASRVAGRERSWRVRMLPTRRGRSRRHEVLAMQEHNTTTEMPDDSLDRLAEFVRAEASSTFPLWRRVPSFQRLPDFPRSAASVGSIQTLRRSRLGSATHLQRSSVASSIALCFPEFTLDFVLVIYCGSTAKMRFESVFWHLIISDLISDRIGRDDSWSLLSIAATSGPRCR